MSTAPPVPPELAPLLEKADNITLTGDDPVAVLASFPPAAKRTALLVKHQDAAIAAGQAYNARVDELTREYERAKSVARMKLAEALAKGETPDPAKALAEVTRLEVLRKVAVATAPPSTEYVPQGIAAEVVASLTAEEACILLLAAARAHAYRATREQALGRRGSGGTYAEVIDLVNRAWSHARPTSDRSASEMKLVRQARELAGQLHAQWRKAATREVRGKVAA